MTKTICRSRLGFVDPLKTCKVCKTPKPRSDFYAHPAMKDGLLGKCKECQKAASSATRRASIERITAYDSARQRTASRRAKKLGYQATHRARHPLKYKARNAVSNALRDGRLVRQPCEVCVRKDAQAHHHDYAKPLDVRWLCFEHHREDEHGQTVRGL